MHVLGVDKRLRSWYILESRLGLGRYLVIRPMIMIWSKLTLRFVSVNVVSYAKIFLECVQYILLMYAWFKLYFSSTLTHDTWRMCYVTWISLTDNLMPTLIYVKSLNLLWFGKEYTGLWYGQLNRCTIFFNVVQTVHFWPCILTWFSISIKFPTKWVFIRPISKILIGQHFLSIHNDGF